MTVNSYYNPTGTPATGAPGSSAPVRGEFNAVAAGFALLPTLSGNGGRAVVVNPGGTGLTVTTGQLALAGNLTTTGAFNTTLAQTATVTLTLPAVSGTLATLAGAETLSNKTLVAPALGTPASGVLTNCTGTAAGLTAGNVTTNAPTATSLALGGASIGSNALAVTGTVSFGTALGVTSGGTGVATVTGILKGNGTSAFSAATNGTDYVAPTLVAALTAGTQIITGGSFQGSAGKINALGSITGSNSIDYTLGNIVTATQNSNTLTFTFTNWPASGTYGSIELVIALDSTPHSVTITGVSWDTTVGAPTLTASKTAHILCETIDGGSTVRGTFIGCF